MSGMEKLFHQIFILDEYSSLVRPIDSNSITTVQTELKLLQVDLVKNFFSFSKNLQH